MIVEFKLNSQDEGDLAIMGFLFNHLKVDQASSIPEDQTPPDGKPTGKKRGRKPKQQKGADGKTESEIKDLDFNGMSAYLLHKESDPSEFEVRWFAKQYKKKHGDMDPIREIINELGAHNFTDLPAEKYKKFCTLVAEKDASIKSDSEDDLDI